jgi:hypothetical protein
MIRELIQKFKQETNDELMSKLELESVARRKRNEARIEAIKQEMGERWVLHPSHKKGKLDEPRPV